MTPSAEADTAPARGASRRTVLLFALAGIAAALAIFSLMTPAYEAELVLDVSNAAGSISDEIAVVESDAVLDVAESLVGFRPVVSVVASEVAGSLTIIATADDPQDAADAATAVADTYVLTESAVAASIAEAAAVPEGRTGLGWPVFVIIGGLIGALAGFFIGSIQRSQADKPPARHRQPDDPDQETTSSLPPESSPPASTTSAASAASAVAPDTPATAASMGSSSAHTQQVAAHPQVSASLTPERPTHTSTTTGPMTSRPSSFSDATKPDTEDRLSWLGDASVAGNATQLSNLGRRALQSQHEANRYELVLAHAQEVAHLTAEHERATIDLRNEVAALTKKVRVHETRVKSLVGNDQTRTGDLEAQVDALEVELATLRQTLESERIAHARRITEDRNAADRALDSARREYRDELGKHVHSHRQTVADHRVELDAELARDRARHAASLEEAHADYERQLESERAKTDTRLAALSEQHGTDIDTLRKANRHELDRQAAQQRATIGQLRSTAEDNEAKLRDVEKENRTLRVEISAHQKRARNSEAEQATATQRAADELALLTAELEGERERNAALRADVLRRSAEAHQAIDKAVEERTAQLSELEAAVARQRQYADTRVREISAAAEEQARQAASREANLTATISRLNRELEEAKRNN